MLVLVLPPVSSRVSGFPVASPCLWGKLQNLSFCHVANCEKCRKSRTKCCFFCIHVSCLESLVFLWRRRVYGGSWKTCPFRMFPGRLCCCFAWQTWHFLTFQPVWWCSQNFKIGGSLVGNAGFSAPTCLVASLSFSCGVAVSMGEAGKPVLFECFQAGCHVVLRGRHGTLWHSNLFDNMWKISTLAEVSHEMLVFLHPRVSFRVSGFPVGSPCLWGKLQKVSFAKVSNLECTGLLVQWGLRFVKIWQEWDHVVGGKLLCGLIRISQSVVYIYIYICLVLRRQTLCRLYIYIYIFLVLCRQTFRLCSIARERQAFTVHDTGGW